MEAQEILRTIEVFLLNAGAATIEGDKFSMLKGSEFVIRSFEFALADGGVDCSTTHNVQSSYAERFWDVDSRQETPDASNIALFDIKSTASDQGYIGSVAQRNRIAFFLGVNAADPTYVDLIPNFFQKPEYLGREVGAQEKVPCLVAHWNKSRLRSSYAGGLSLATTPYRMHMRLLPEAIRRVRAHVRGETIYTNPETNVSFPDWHPATVKRTDCLKPSEAGHQSACEAVINIFQAIKYLNLPIELDFVGLQPRLADFKLKLRDHQRQYFVQHKMEGRLRKDRTPLENVAIARGDGKKRGWYFTSVERFDFLFFQFEFSQHPDPCPRIEFIFCPEKYIPEEFYTTTSMFVSFERTEFTAGPQRPGRRGFRVSMDGEGGWVKHVLDIVLENPQPRKIERPVRDTVSYLLPETDEDSFGIEPTTAPRAEEETLGSSGWQEYEAVMTQKHQEFFHAIMRRCASRRSGLLFETSRNHAFGDFGFCLYDWSAQEAASFLSDGRPPQFLHTLPPSACAVPITYYVRHVESSFLGPGVSASQFRRLNASSIPRLLMWDLAGIDTDTSLSIIPSLDMTASAAQRQGFESNLRVSRGEWAAKTPLVSGLLRTGAYPSEYVTGSASPLEPCDWDSVLSLLDSFAGDRVFEHPACQSRHPTLYHRPILEFNERLVRDHLTSVPLKADEED